MEDDSPAFSLVILAKEQWDMFIGSNDLIRIKAIPDRSKGEPDNPYIMVGLISDIHKEGEYNDGILLYRITGRAMSKATMDFDVGVIQEVSTVIGDTGWLPDGVEAGGINLSGRSAAEIGEQLMNRFLFEYAKYNFAGDRGLPDFLVYDFESWEDESLSDVLPFVNYQGSIRQFLEDVAAKPFNELYFEYTKDGKCAVIMRPTPFDPDKWNELFTYKITSDIVVEESFGKSDAEMYSVFVVQAPNIPEYSSIDLGVFPQTHQELIRKYGYKRLDVENRYLLSEGLADVLEEYQEEREANNGGYVTEPPVYEDVLAFIVDNKYNNLEYLRTNRNDVKAGLLSNFPNMDDTLAESIIDSLIDEDFTRERYGTISMVTGNEELDRTINEEKSVAGEKLKQYTKRVFNWYAENANFYSGDIRIIGNPAYRVGTRLLYEDNESETTWEFYVESVQHEFSFSNGYTTIIGVTRGLPEKGKDRFNNLWGQSEDFMGGYLGEPSIEQLLEKAREAAVIGDGGSFSGWGMTHVGGVASAALDTARRISLMDSVYTWGGGRNGSNPFLSTPVKVDCSSFIWWCYYENGVSLNGGKTGMTTDTIKNDPKLTTISPRGASKKEAASKLLQGDIVYFDTYKGDGHIGIYAGGGTFIGAQSSTGVSSANMDSGYWWDKFNGRVLRYSG